MSEVRELRPNEILKWKPGNAKRRVYDVYQTATETQLVDALPSLKYRILFYGVLEGLHCQLGEERKDMDYKKKKNKISISTSGQFYVYFHGNILVRDR